MTYRPQEFWERRLSEQFDLRGTGQPGLSEAYNRACYDLRRAVLEQALRDEGFDPRGKRVLDVGCGTGFFTAFYLSRGANLTGIDIAPTSIERLRQRHPEARFLLADVGETPIEGGFDLVNAFDVLYHITDDARFEHAVRTLAGAVGDGGLLLLTDTFPPDDAPARAAEHNRMRPLSRYRSLLEPAGFQVRAIRPTHVLLNRELGAFRFLNRAPALLYAMDRALLSMGLGQDPAVSKLLVARRAGLRA
ncbi:MAG TPA: class I SAM-dependent methyltransferase [Candidatus Eisenbacteria bacterium]|nr:class I SAM-dependent methyltransferase [Candidatus Eisenbacteria bacterium]